MLFCEDKLNRKTADFRLPSVAQKRRVLELSNDDGDGNEDVTNLQFFFPHALHAHYSFWYICF